MKQLLTIFRVAAPHMLAWVARHTLRVLLHVAAVSGFFAVVLGVAAYFVASGGTPLVGWIAAGVVLIGAVIVGAAAGVPLAATKSINEWVAGLGLGASISKALFAETLGVTDKRPLGGTDLVQSLQGATVGDARRKLREAFHNAFESRSLDRWLPSQGRWLASRIVNGVGWVGAKMAVDKLPGNATDTANVDLLGLRDSVGERIESLALTYTTGQIRRFAGGVLLIGSAATIALILLAAWAAPMLGG